MRSSMLNSRAPTRVGFYSKNNSGVAQLKSELTCFKVHKTMSGFQIILVRTILFPSYNV